MSKRTKHTLHVLNQMEIFRLRCFILYVRSHYCLLLKFLNAFDCSVFRLLEISKCIFNSIFFSLIREMNVRKLGL